MNGFLTVFKENEESIIGWGFILLILLAWEVIPVLVTLPKGLSLFFTTPYHVVVALYGLFNDGNMLHHFYVSAFEFFVGLCLSIIVALPLGIIMGRFTTMNAMFDPFVTAFNATPRLVFLHLVLLWVGLGIWSKVVIVFIGALFPLLINTIEGVKNVDRVLVNVVRSFGAGEWQIMKMVVLPNSLPYIVAGLRLAIGRAILGVVVGEFFGSSEGLGFVMAAAAGNYQVDILFAGLILFMGISLAMTMSVKRLESRLSSWRPEDVKTF
ncbi:MAG: ABC transporter permease [Deltaproteobacteria bacterium]|nr:ABC transporter permease [Deltaproteobacteria bacterium]